MVSRTGVNYELKRNVRTDVRRKKAYAKSYSTELAFDASVFPENASACRLLRGPPQAKMSSHCSGWTIGTVAPFDS
jgi:hypothetical protein